MNSVELRHIINERISLIDDESFLSAIKTILDSKVSSAVYKLSDFQKERINSGREQFKNGETISNDDLQSEISQWLNTK
jgi:uncharacterized coiled-coil DUF342 family protein